MVFSTGEGLGAGLQVRPQAPPSNFVKIEKPGWSAIVEADFVIAVAGNGFVPYYLFECLPSSSMIPPIERGVKPLGW